MLLPVLGKAKTKAQGIYCMNNGHQITLALQVYAGDYDDMFPPNDFYTGPPAPPGNFFGPVANQINWVGGGEDFVAANTQNTDVRLLTDWAALGKYNPSYKAYHCPADSSAAPGKGQRLRSVSMNSTVGTSWNSGINASYPRGSELGGTWLKGTWSNPGPNTTVWKTFGKLGSMTRPGPANTWIIVDEHPLSINDPVFCVGMGATDDGNGNASWTQFVDSPASYHNGACGFSFGDGHSEIHKWLGGRVKQGGNNYPAGDSSGDLKWLQQRTTALK
jgi:prepilin-type processing-associated H-X9-DG protein